jgi:uncharacterized protein (TIGR02611 family)
MQEQPRHAAVDHLRAVRERIRSSRTGRLVYRFVVALLGVAITVGGLLLVPLPGPGWLVVLAGLAVLATEFEPARRVLEFARERLRRWTAWVGRQGVAVRAGVGLGTLACVGLGLWGTAVVAGVPAWVPDAVVPPLPGLRR